MIYIALIQEGNCILPGRQPTRTVAVEVPQDKLPGALHIEAATMMVYIPVVHSPGTWAPAPVVVPGIPARIKDMFLVSLWVQVAPDRLGSPGVIGNCLPLTRGREQKSKQFHR